MKRIAIIGGGISGLTAAYYLEKARLSGCAVDWQLYEASDRLGGVIQTTRREGFVLEGGPDGWVTEKPAARQLVVELGLEQNLLPSLDATRKTYIALHGELVAIPDRMRMMVPEDLQTLENSALFSEAAKQAYAAEPLRAEELKASAPREDESVGAFVERHFGTEVLEKIAAPLLGGVFGGDVNRLSVQAVMPQFVAMEREYGSLITALQSRVKQQNASTIFTSLRGGMQKLVDAIVQTLPTERVHYNTRVDQLPQDVDFVVVATSLDATRKLVSELAAYLPQKASSAVLVAMAWKQANFKIPQGFGFLVPDGKLLAATFVDQKFAERVPEGGRIIRAFFSTDEMSDAKAVETAQVELNQYLGGVMTTPDFSIVTRWPRSLPQYEVGHLERLQKMAAIMEKTPGILVLGNMTYGVGIPDLIAQAKKTVAKILE